MSKENKILIWSIIAFLIIFSLRGLLGIDWQKWQQSWQEKWKKSNVPEASTAGQLIKEPLLPEELQGVELFYGEKHTLLLYNDGNFYLTEAYKKGETKVKVETGTWINDQEKNIVTLTYETGTTEQWKRLENQNLQKIEKNGQPGEILGKETNVADKVVNLKN